MERGSSSMVKQKRMGRHWGNKKIQCVFFRKKVQERNNHFGQKAMREIFSRLSQRPTPTLLEGTRRSRIKTSGSPSMKNKFYIKGSQFFIYISFFVLFSHFFSSSSVFREKEPTENNSRHFLLFFRSLTEEREEKLSRLNFSLPSRHK